MSDTAQVYACCPNRQFQRRDLQLYSTRRRSGSSCVTCVDCVKQLCGRIVDSWWPGKGQGSAGFWWLDMPKLGITLGPTVVRYPHRDRLKLGIRPSTMLEIGMLVHPVDELLRVPVRYWSSHTRQYSTVQYSTVQYSTVQYSTVHYSTAYSIQYSKVQ